MVPSHFVSLEKIPLTPNGKTDRKSLPESEASRLKPAVKYLEPTTELERIIADIWKQELGLERVGINDNFFSLGGSSLDLVKVNHRLKESFGKNITMVTHFKYRTIATFARYLNREDGWVYKRDRTDALMRGEQDRLKRFQMRKGKRQ